MFFIEENVYENVVCNMAAILSRCQCVKYPCNQQGWYWLYKCITCFSSFRLNFNTLRPEQNGHHFADDIFMTENYCILITVSLIAWTHDDPAHQRHVASSGHNEVKFMPFKSQEIIPGSKVHGANMGPTWVLSAPDVPHVGPMNLAIRDMLIHIYVFF